MEQTIILNIEKKIYFIRGYNVMLDSDLAALYEIDTKRLNEQVKRNLERFPDDFMFQLTDEEVQFQRSQFATFDEAVYKRKYYPYVFTENGVAMLSSILNSPRAIQVNIAIMRIFTKLRSFIMLNNDLIHRVNKLEDTTNQLFKVVFERLDAVEVTSVPFLRSTRKKIGLRKD